MRRKVRRAEGKTARLVFSKGEVRQAAKTVYDRIDMKGALAKVPAEAVVVELLSMRESSEKKVKPADRRKLRRAVVKVLSAPPEVRIKSKASGIFARTRKYRVGSSVPPGFRVEVVVTDTSPSKETVILDDPAWQRSIGPTYGAAEVEKLLREPRHTLAKRARQRSLLALRTSDGHTVYPVFQFAGNQVLPGIGAVLREFPDDDPDLFWTIASWMRKPLTTLNERSVIEALNQGEIDAAVKAANATASRWSR
ncbi:hypothetical protein [Streptomyces sp. NPDC001165]|uniref:hypothetical protein n=1 Tax=Streptomyces sp. NPDC001165 TaxID=3364546 RepID=UPI0036CEAB5F